MHRLFHKGHEAIVCFDGKASIPTDALEDRVVIDRLQADCRLTHSSEKRAPLCGRNQFCSKFVLHCFRLRIFPYSTSDFLRMDELFRTCRLTGMSLVSKKALLEAMETAGIQAAPLALTIGRDKDYIRDYLKGRKRSLKADDLQKIADALGVPLQSLIGSHREVSADQGMVVMGKVAAGVYKDVSIDDQDEYGKPRIAVARDLRFPNVRQYALEVEGDSMNELFPNGGVVICVDYADSGVQLRNGMCVHVERHIIDGQLIENTLKEVVVLGKGKFSLIPRSTNPSHKPISLSGGETDSVVVKGIVIGKWEPISYGF